MSAVEKTLRWIVLAGIFLVPTVAVIVADGLFFPFITGKNFTFRIIVEIISGAWLALALVSPQYRPKRAWILYSFTLFVIIMAIADAQGVNPFKSFWSNYERMDGWVTLIHVLLLTVVSACMLNAEHLWRRLFEWSLVISAFISSLGILQVAGFLDFGSGGTGLNARVDATFGNPIYLAVYMLFNVFLAALLWVQEGKEEWNIAERVAYPLGAFLPFLLTLAQTPTGSDARLFVVYLLFVACVLALQFARRSYLLCAIMVFDTIALLFSGTRGATLGLIGGGLLALILYAFSRDGSKRLRQYTIGLLVVAVVLASGLWAARDTSAVQSVAILNRLSSISLSDSDTFARIVNIEMAWKGIEERPILGWGQENYAIVFDKFYDPRMYAQEQWFDRVHDVVFDWWVAGGTLGLLSYLSIFVAALWALWRPSAERGSTEASTSNVRSNAFSRAERAILTGLLAGYFIHLLTVFDSITSYILFAFVLGYIVYRQTDVGVILKKEFLPRGSLPLVAVVAALVVLGAAWYVNADALAENQALINAITPSADPSQNLADFEKAISYGTYGTQEAREQLAQITVEILTPTSGVPASVQSAFVQEAVQQEGLQEKVSPLDARAPLFAGTVLSAAGDYAQATQELNLAHQLSPDKQSILFAMAQNAQSAGQTSLELQDLQTAYTLDTDDLDARLYYAAALITTGQYAQAQTVLSPIVASGQAADPRITSAYASQKDYAPLIPIWQAALTNDPSNIQDYFTLAAIYYADGNKPAAIAVLQQAVAASSSIASQVQQYIQEINNGTVPTTSS